METLKAFLLEHLMMQHLASLTVQCLVFLLLPNLEKNLAVRKVYHLVYLSELMKASQRVPCLVQLKALLKAVHLAYLSELLKESSRDLYLDLRITSKMVTNYELLWVLLISYMMAKG